MIIHFYPCITSLEELSDHVHRAAWHLSPFADRISEVRFTVSGRFRTSKLAPPRAELDPALAEISANFKQIKIVKGNDEKAKAALKSADFIFVHDEDTRDPLIKSNTGKALPPIVRVDHHKVQYATSFYLRFSERIDGLYDSYREEARKRAERLLAPLKTQRAYLFGTGPNFDFTKSFDFSDGLTIACNSMVANPEVMQQLDPKVIVASDPIFHAGPSKYAAKFRDSLIREMRARKVPFIVPMRDFHIFTYHLPEDLQDLVIPIEYEAGEAARLDLLTETKITTTSNVLTGLLIPLGATLAEEIYISGCDGRPLKQNDYFWSHSKTVQISEEMQSIQTAHPSFFLVSYDDYYETHIQTLETWCQGIEALGKSVHNLTPSYIPALQSRHSQRLLTSVADARSERPKVSIVIPCYNAAEFLEEAVQSILDDVSTDIEIILIDDFSEDGTVRIANEIADRAPQVKIFPNFCGKGVSGARNTGIALAKGTYIGFLDADDEIGAGSLSARIRALDENPDWDMVHGPRYFTDARGRHLGCEVGTKRKVTFADAMGNPASFNTILVRAVTLQQHLHFDETLTNGEDWLAYIALLRKGFDSHYVPEGSASYRIHGGSVVIKDYQAHEAKLQPVLDWVFSEAPGHEAADNWRAGHDPKKRAGVETSRLLGNLIFAALAGNTEVTAELLKDANLREFVSNPDGQFDRRFIVPSVRVTQLHVDQLNPLPNPWRQRMLAFTEALDKDKAFEQVCLATIRVYGLDQPDPGGCLLNAVAADGQLTPIDLATADLTEVEHALALYDDPRRLVASHMHRGGNSDLALDRWTEDANTLLALFRRNRRKVVLAERDANRSALGNILRARGVSEPQLETAEIAETDPLLHTLAELAFAKNPAAGRAFDELRASSAVPMPPEPADRIDASVKRYRELSAQSGTSKEDAQKITFLEDKVFEKSRAMERRDEMLAKKDSTIELMTEQLNQLQATLESHVKAAMADKALAEDLRRQLLDREHNVRHLQEQLDNVFGSNSWRVTGPLRKVSKAVGRGK